ncbi:non-SMC mitotic condensation complex subunit 1-domain-containing protein [Gigaspora rosea]|uniref:Non-SMC mitotic condensation complex subunit 1-domain-containing protein n=1 Tax=Gigaspora rosea TaxID=44941 RepID=A0A397U020_9GLOM|nr:non-SMC mitotic condensation complex subunit 1-domain-containing protein [Gigaspora rosea]
MPDLSNQQNSSADEIMKLQLTRRYYSDAVRFIHQVYTAVPTLCQLLGSTTKSEVLETMEFFVTAYTYKMEFAIDGIKRMLHLIWIKDNNDEGKGIRKRLIESYYKLYIETDISLSSREAVNAVTKNLISLTYNATLAELTSLEQLMSTMMAEELISNDAIAHYNDWVVTKLGFAVAEQAINTIYLLGEHPDILCGEIIKHKTASVFDLKIPKADDMDIDGDNFLPDQEGTPPSTESTNIYSWAHTEKSTKNPGDDELEQVAGTIEDEFGDAVAHIREKELLFGENSLLAVFGQLISNICANNKTYNHHTLQICATLSLAKLMCVSSEFCENNLQLLFTILERSNEPTIRSNIIISLGDITVCFNNIIDENINYLYKRLADSDNLVKKNTLMVLTHLILNRMIKVKGQLGEMAKCLKDEDQRISDLARLFFTELASKDNAVYNNLPDIISNLSSGDNPDKHIENVVEKLCQRFKNLDDRRQWRNIANCLSLLPYKSERIIKKLLEGMSHYQDKLHENDVHKAFTDIITKARSIKPQKPEMKQLIDEYESKIEEFRQRSQE